MRQRDISETKSGPPASATSFGLNLIALVVLLLTLYVLRRYEQHLATADRRLSSADAMLILMAALSTPVILIDLLVLRVHRRASSGLDWDLSRPADGPRILTKLVGLVVTLAPIAFAYWVFPEYQGSFYDPLYNALRRFWVALAFMAPVYIWFVDGLMVQPRDAYWQLGRFFLGHRSDARGPDIANHYRGWLVKAYFFPLMFVWMHNSVHQLITYDLGGAAWSNLRAYDFLYTLVFGVDLLFTTAGYALSMRVIDTHIRSAEPTMLGWTVALFCYQPFFSLFEKQYVAYGDGPGFGAWLETWPTVRWIWAAIVIALLATYSLATVAFGVRFSNLTHRGILTGGPYRFSKHPAYLTKNLSWWLISIPFLHAPPATAIRHSFGLACINTMYFLRARTEERHLSRDPVYIAYALWMNDHGLLSFLGRWIPALAYKAPPAREAPAPAPTAPAPPVAAE
jgi:protein-S-isoprenylcysteine O-methyltransferase Ste14